MYFQRITRLIVLATISSSLFISAAAGAADRVKVKDIRVSGLERISIGTVFNYLPIKVGDSIEKNDVAKSIRSLFKTGFFKDVKISRQNSVLIVTVTERPSISEVAISGGKKITEEQLNTSIKGAGISVGRTFSRSLFDQIEQELKEQYFNLGYYSVEIESSIESAGGNKVKVIIKIAEGKPARISDINIIGNKAFPDKRLLSLFRQQTSKRKRIFSKRDQYSQRELRADIEKIQNHYLDHGYLDFGIKNQQVSISTSKESIFITLSIIEGPQYKVGDVGLKGRLILKKELINSLVTLKEGEIFSRKEVASIVEKITELYGENGYANAKITAIPKTNAKTEVVDFNFLIDPGKRVYIRRISISGNNTTKDKVIRRELRQLEGSWYSIKKVRDSKRRLQRLGYFENVSVSTEAVSSSADLVDLKVTVKERSTGSVSLGGGYSDENGFFVNVSYNERNAFGSGSDIVLSYDNSQATTVYEASYNNPYYTKNGISRQLELHSRTTDATQTQTGGYVMESNGFGVNYGIPISDDRKVGVGVGLEQINIITDASSANVAQTFVANNGNKNTLLRATLSWSEDTLNDYRFPTTGSLYKVNIEGGIPGSDLQYIKSSIDSSIYYPFGEKSTLRVRGMIGLASPYGSSSEVPFFKNFFAGGSSTVRGFRARSLGPRDVGVNTDPIGGTKVINANMEYFFPFPGSKSQDSSMRLSLFLDAGMVYAANEAVDTSALRYSAGMAFTWFTPAFPLALSLGFPVNSQSGDDLESFQFSIGIPIR